RGDRVALEHDPEKCEAVFRKDHKQAERFLGHPKRPPMKPFRKAPTKTTTETTMIQRPSSRATNKMRRRPSPCALPFCSASALPISASVGSVIFASCWGSEKIIFKQESRAR